MLRLVVSHWIFMACENTTDKDMKELADAFASGLTSLPLNYEDGKSVTDEGLQVLARVLPSGLAKLSVNFKGCADIIEEALENLNRALPSNLTDLFLDFSSEVARTSMTRA